MTEHEHDLPGARQALGDAVHALAGRTSTRLDRDELDREQLDRDLTEQIAAAEQAHIDAEQALNARIQAATRAGHPWDDTKIRQHRQQLDDTMEQTLTSLQLRHELAVVATTSSVAFGESLLDQLRHFTSARTGQTRARAGGFAPIQVDALDLLTTIDRQTAIWCAEPGTTADRLNWIADRQYRPQDTPDLHTMAATINAWADQAAQIIDPPSRMSVAAPCPECDATVVYRPDSGGEVVRQPALQISDRGCQCQRCRTLWPPESYQLLAQVLQLPAPEGVVEEVG